MFTELLAESDFPAQGILFIIVIIFSFLKWLFGKLVNKKEEGEQGALESLYDQYRDEIRQRQSQVTHPPVKPDTSHLNVATAPPVLPQKTQKPKPQKPKFSSVDIEKARIAKLTRSNQRRSTGVVSKASQAVDTIAIRKKLHSKEGLRQVIIARQILGPPRGLSEYKF